jgi:endonuclease/exonuclease/phosphatase family metal-dependent hydrolase
MASNRSAQEGRKSVLRVLSFNVRQDVESDGENRWENRKERVADIIGSWAPDIAGLQEPYFHQLNHLLEALPEYSYAGVGRDDGRAEGEFCPILYNKSRMAALDGGTFWLSETPDIPGSMGWGSRHPRICTWVRFSSRQTYQGFYVYNVHLDHESVEARENGTALLTERIRRRTGLVPVIVTGDFNTGPSDHVITTMCAADSPAPIDAFAALSPRNTAQGTYHAFTGKGQDPRIDYIFVSPEWQVEECRIITESGPKFSSDHFPVGAVLKS